MSNTKIEWATKVWNPTTGCTKVSQGCKNCYAERMANRFWRDRSFSEVICHLERLDDPFKWHKPQRIFVDSMSDLFHPDVSEIFITDIFATMAISQQHTFLILTKRPMRMKNIIEMPRFETSIEMHIERICAEHGWCQSDIVWPLPNIWLGVSVEDQKTADERIPILLQTPSAVRFVSYEPALGIIDFNSAAWGFGKPRPSIAIQARQLENPLAALDWVIMGCETGPGARPMNIKWAWSTLRQCQAAHVPFFFKQAMNSGKLVHMPELDGKVWAEFPNDHFHNTIEQGPSEPLGRL